MNGGEAEWWYETDGVARGPVAASEIRSMIAAGELGPGSRVIPHGGDRWGTVDEYATRLGLLASEHGSRTPLPPSAPATLPASAGVRLSGQERTPPLASLFTRFGAHYLDLFLLPATLFVGWIVWSIVIWPKGLSPGKQLMRLRVLDAKTGQPPGEARMATREAVAKFLFQVLSLGIVTIVSGFMLLVTDSRQAVWDKIMGTVVIDEGAGGLERKGWALLGLAMVSFLLAFGASNPEGDTTGGAEVFGGIMLAVGAGLAITGIAILSTSLFRRGRGTG